MLGSEDNQVGLTDTEAFCSKLLKPGSIYEFLSKNRRRLFPDEKFTHLYPSKLGRPSIPPSTIASIMVLQTLEGLSDREAMEQVRLNLSWKMALGLRLDDEGFSPNVLTYWRNKIAKSDSPHLIFELAKEVVQNSSILSGKNKRVLDSTVLADCVLTQDTFSQIVAQIKRVRRSIPSLGNVSLSQVVDYSSSERKPSIDYRDPGEKEEAISLLVADATSLIDAASELELTSEQQDAVGLLGLVAFQDVEIVDELEGRFKLANRVARDRIVSSVDPDARHVHKSRKAYLDGYRGHIAIDPETELITSSSLEKGNMSDAQVGVKLLLDEKESLKVYGDSGYSQGEFFRHLDENGHSQVIKPRPLHMAVEDGFSIDDFLIDETSNTVSCPASHVVAITQKGRASFSKFCGTCPLRKSCTRSKRGRTITFGPNHKYNQQARSNFKDSFVKDDYNATRPSVERIHAQMKRKMPSSKIRYRGILKNDIYYCLIAAVWNLKVLIRNNLTYGDTGWQIAGSTSS